jgi:hypothetical protein
MLNGADDSKCRRCIAAVTSPNSEDLVPLLLLLLLLYSQEVPCMMIP